jgi:CheY-like chemotaxis protein
MIACSHVRHAELANQALRGEVTQLYIAPQSDRLAAAFDSFRPDVVVFAFESLADSDTALREVYRNGRAVVGHPHRMLVLCTDDELQAAFELCQQGHFDDFVRWDADTQDSRRLRMSVRMAWGKLALQRRAELPLGELLPHVRHLAETEDLVGRLIDAAAKGSEAALAAANELKGPLRAALAGTRALADKVAQIRPLVMVVDDDALARQLIASTLDSQAFDLRFAGDGIEALYQLRRLRPDVILTDVRMPGLDGVSLTQRLKAEPLLARIPIIMMTGDSRRETLASSINVGAAAFLLKPYTRERLTAKIERVLGVAALHR